MIKKNKLFERDKKLALPGRELFLVSTIPSGNGSIELKMSSLRAGFSCTQHRKMMTQNNEINPKRFIVTGENIMMVKAGKVFIT